jgi:hypothetical protein
VGGNLLFLGLILSLFVIAFCNILTAWRGSDVTRLARVIETKPAPASKYFNPSNYLSAEYFLQFERGRDMDNLGKLCLDDLSRSILTIRLASLRSLQPTITHTVPSKMELQSLGPTQQRGTCQKVCIGVE